MQTKDAEVLSRSFLAGTGTAMLSNRISHFYDLQGPSMSIDTGCSAGIVAVHQACQSIRTEESEISIVGAASTLLSQDAFISASTIGYVRPITIRDLIAQNVINNGIARSVPRASAMPGMIVLLAMVEARVWQHLFSNH